MFACSKVAIQQHSTIEYMETAWATVTLSCSDQVETPQPERDCFPGNQTLKHKRDTRNQSSPHWTWFCEQKKSIQN